MAKVYYLLQCPDGNGEMVHTTGSTSSAYSQVTAFAYFAFHDLKEFLDEHFT
jgi:hypothetical protein